MSFDITGYTGKGIAYDYTGSCHDWGTGNGGMYGKSNPTGLGLLGKGANNGEIFWYNLYETAMDDIYIYREW